MRTLRKLALLFVLPLALLATAVVMAGAASAKSAPPAHFTYATPRTGPDTVFGTNGALFVDFKLAGIGQPYATAVFPIVRSATATYQNADGSFTTLQASLCGATGQCTGQGYSNPKGGSLTGTVTLDADFQFRNLYNLAGSSLVSVTYNGIAVVADNYYTNVGEVWTAPYSATPSSITWP